MHRTVDGRTADGLTRLARWRTVAAVCLGAPFLHAVAASASDPAPTETEINRDETNPLGNAWLLKLESNTYLLEIDEFHTRRLEQNVQFQPRLSLQLTEDLWFVTRPTLNLFESDPYKDDRGALSRSIGFGDTELPMVLSPGTGPAWLLGAGPTFVLPSASSRETGKGKFEAGPAAVAGWRSSDWLAALFAQQFWSFAGSGQRKNVSELKVQYYLTRFLADGWSIGMSPTVEVNWKADGGQQLTFPVGLGIGKVLKLGNGSAIKLGLQLQYMPIHPDDFGKEANLQLSVTPTVPPPVRSPLFGGGPQRITGRARSREPAGAPSPAPRARAFGQVFETPAPQSPR